MDGSNVGRVRVQVPLQARQAAPVARLLDHPQGVALAARDGGSRSPRAVRAQPCEAGLLTQSLVGGLCGADAHRSAVLLAGEDPAVRGRALLAPYGQRVQRLHGKVDQHWRASLAALQVELGAVQVGPSQAHYLADAAKGRELQPDQSPIPRGGLAQYLGPLLTVQRCGLA